MNGSVDFLRKMQELPITDRIDASLVYCDWLEENGHASEAEYTRVMIERSKVVWMEPAWEELTARLEIMKQQPMDYSLLPVLPGSFYSPRKRRRRSKVLTLHL